jgi:hypothetical protein
MNDFRKLCSLVALAGVAAGPFAVGCGGGNSQPSSTPPSGSVSVTQPPPGYQPGGPPGYPGQPAGYPQQQAYPQQGYPQQQQAPAGYPQQQQGYPQQQQPMQQQPMQPQPAAGAPAASAAAGPLAATDPSSLQGILAGLQAAIPGQMALPGGMTADPVEAGLKLIAAKDAPGMQPEGQELKQTLNEGQHAVMMVTLQAGKCYAILGFSPPAVGVKDLDLNLMAPPLYMTLAGQDMTHTNTAAIGAAPSPMCPVVLFPLQYKLDVFARSGSGPVVVQLFSKNK